MRKFLPILTLALASFFVYSCDTNDDDVIQVEDQDTISQMRDVTVTLNSGNGYAHVEPLNILNTDVVLVYRRDPSALNAWQLIPKSYYLSGSRVLDYNFLFSAQKVEIYVEGSQASLSTAETNEFLNGQTFRIVLVPANAAKGANSTPVDYNDYNAVIKYYNLNDTKVPVSKVN